MKGLIAFFKEEDGLELTKYGVMGALIAATLVATITALQKAVGGEYTELSSIITNNGN